MYSNIKCKGLPCDGVWKDTDHKVCLVTIDVEQDSADPNKKSRSYAGVEAMHSLTQEILDSWEINITMFVTGDVIENCRYIIKDLANRNGNEVAAHGLRHIPITNIPISHRKKELAELKVLSSKYIGVNLKGFRAVKFMIDTETMNVINKMDFAYDCSVVPRKMFLKQSLGYKGKAPKYPYHPDENDYRKEGSLEIFEFPLSTLYPSNIPLVGTWIRYLGAKITKLLMISEMRYINLCIHSWDFANTKKYGWKTGKRFTRILNELIQFLYEKDYHFYTGTSLCDYLRKCAGTAYNDNS